MTIFAIACLIIIILVATHLLNWMWREVTFELVAPLIGTIFYIILMILCFKYVILWAYPLIS